MAHIFLKLVLSVSALLTLNVHSNQLTPYRIHCPQPCSTCNQCPQEPLVQEGFIPLAATTINNQVVPAANIFARLEGAYVPGKPIIVMIHYLEGSSRSFSCTQKAFAAAGYSTLALDMRGRGNSTKTDPATFFYTNQALANDIHGVLVALGIQGPIIFVGAVSGGYPVLKYFELFSTPSSPLYDADRTVSHMILINSGPGLTTVPDCAGLPGCVQDSTTCCVAGATCPFPCAGPNCCVCYEFGNVTCAGINFFFTPLFSTPAGYLSAACSFAVSAMGEDCSPQIEVARKAFTEDFLKTTGDIQINLYKNSLAEDLRSVIPTLNIPLLVVYGSISATIPGSSIYLSQNAPNAKLVLFEGVGELPYVTMVSKYNTLMAEFLNGASLPASTVFPFLGCDICPTFVPTRPINCP
jgi:pimeloyl-ACP methyl ester carboxylesterase